ncbi:MAG: hypothetical protein H6765_04415 [Candidatus Peribacteria bacterium]|nr:MAG: hypothetical protein H6765_04415 [Candidatus Peribacteria bacterium]
MANTETDGLALEVLTQKQLAERLAAHPDNFKHQDQLNRLQHMDKDALLRMNKLLDKYPGIRFTSTIRTKEENDAMPDDVRDENSAHMYGLGFDIGRSQEIPPAYELEDVEEFAKTLSPEPSTLIHGT